MKIGQFILTYSLSWMLPKLFWIMAVWKYAAITEQPFVRVSLPIAPEQVQTGLARLDQQVGSILRKIIPARN